MKLVPEVSWRGRAPVDARLVPLLRAIRGHATLRAAAAALGVSYRSAWDLLAAESRSLGAPLVVMARGRGAKLAPLAERLLSADDAVRRELERLEPQLAVSVTAAERAAGQRRLRIVASHDLLLAQFCEGLSAPVELAFKGSLESLAALARREADLAGFHVGGDAAPALRLLHARRHRLVRFAAREQGLMVPRGNPKRVRGLADLGAKHLCFVNRQRGSGTRLLFDELLAQGRLRTGDIRGYNTEEFTHLAVAATIAAGRADAGFGVKAAATRFGLDFVPLKRERYWFALRARDQDNAAISVFLRALRGDELRRIARQLPGYDAREAGEVCPIAALTGEVRS
ncbi:MAG: substrate-binding domain-containing protein [Betaproteobacteria bacterium]